MIFSKLIAAFVSFIIEFFYGNLLGYRFIQTIRDHIWDGVNKSNKSEQKYADDDYVGNYRKGLNISNYYEAYRSLCRACQSGEVSDFKNVDVQRGMKLVDPLASYSLSMIGPDTRAIIVPPFPELMSEQFAAQMLELFCMQFTRDINFSDFITSSDGSKISKVISVLRTCDTLKYGKHQINRVNIFRGRDEGSVNGPYISQFLLKDIHQGELTTVQKFKPARIGVDHFQTNKTVTVNGIIYSGYDDVHSGEVVPPMQYENNSRYILTGRDLATYVHRDFPCMFYNNAVAILQSYKIKTAYVNELGKYSGFLNYGVPDIMKILDVVSSEALRMTWYQKWVVHRALRPEEAGKLFQTETNKHFHPKLYENIGFIETQINPTNELKKMITSVYPEGCPNHPSYPAGHAAIAGACITILKAFYDDVEMTECVVPNADGSQLVPYDGKLMLHQELDKLATNIAYGRCWAGIHYSVDAEEGIKFGEKIAIRVLTEIKDGLKCQIEFKFKTKNGAIVNI